MKKHNRIKDETREQNFSSRQGSARSVEEQTREQSFTSSSRRGGTSTISEEDIRKRAYELAEERGFEPGREVEYWLEAEKTIRLNS